MKPNSKMEPEQNQTEIRYHRFWMDAEEVLTGSALADYLASKLKLEDEDRDRDEAKTPNEKQKCPVKSKNNKPHSKVKSKIKLKPKFRFDSKPH